MGFFFFYYAQLDGRRVTEKYSTPTAMKPGRAREKQSLPVVPGTAVKKTFEKVFKEGGDVTLPLLFPTNTTATTTTASPPLSLGSSSGSVSLRFPGTVPEQTADRYRPLAVGF